MKFHRKRLRNVAVFLFIFYWVQGPLVWFFSDSLIRLTGCDKGTDCGSKIIYRIIEHDRKTGDPINEFYWKLGYSIEPAMRAAGKTVEFLCRDFARNCREAGAFFEKVCRATGENIRIKATETGMRLRSSLRGWATEFFYGIEKSLRAIGSGLRDAGYSTREYCYEKGHLLRQLFKKGNEKMVALRNTMESLKKYLRTQSQSIGANFRSYIENFMYVLSWEMDTGPISGSPADMAMDEFRNLYIVDRASSEVLIISREGKLIRKFGSAEGKSLDRPSGICLTGDGKVLVADTGNRRIVSYTRAGTFSGVLELEAAFAGPLDVAVTGTGRIIVTDSSDRLFIFEKNGALFRCTGRRGVAEGEFRSPVCVDTGKLDSRIYIADRENDRIQVFDEDGNWLMEISRTSRNGRLIRPNTVFVHTSGVLFAGDEGKPPVHSFFPNGSYMGGVGRYGRNPEEIWEFCRPEAIAVSLNLTIAIMDSALNKIRVFKLSWDPPDDAPEFTPFPDFM